jgi:hypothetical protein
MRFAGRGKIRSYEKPKTNAGISNRRLVGWSNNDIGYRAG